LLDGLVHWLTLKKAWNAEVDESGSRSVVAALSSINRKSYGSPDATMESTMIYMIL
jgi:hypothetical protein